MGVGDSGILGYLVVREDDGRLTTYYKVFFKPDEPSTRASMQPVYSAPQGKAHSGYYDTPVEHAVDEEQEDKKLQKVLYALSDLIRTPSDHAQIRAINAIESLATKGIYLLRLQFLFHLIESRSSMEH
jgi:hypothetical protein